MEELRVEHGVCVLFVLSWIGQGVAQWQEYTNEQQSHNEPVELGDFSAVFSQATLENWQSEFLQLFSFTVMTALLIHKGSAESRDSDDRIGAALKRVEDRLGTTLTLEDPQPLRRGRDLHVVPDGFEGWISSVSGRPSRRATTTNRPGPSTRAVSSRAAEASPS